MAVPPIIDLASSPNSTQSRAPPSSHRAATISASQALQSLQDSGSNFVPTGLPSLDALLAGSGRNNVNGGFERGKVAELWGPIGSGKTAIALQTAASVVDSGRSVMWVDATEPVNKARFQSLLSAPTTSTSDSTEYKSKFHRYFLPTLSHLLAMILYPKADFFPSDIHLLVLDGLDTLINSDYPRYQTHTSMKPEQQRWQAGRRYAILGSVISALNKLAVLHNMAVIATTSCSTRMRADSGLGAAHVPGVGGAEWEAGVWNRLVVFRDFSGRFVGVQKCQGKTLISREGVGEAGRLVRFDIASNGRLGERELGKPDDRTEMERQKQRPTPVKPPKRSFDEIADSEDEDVDEYGWADADDQALVMEGLAEEAQTTEPAADPG